MYYLDDIWLVLRMTHISLQNFHYKGLWSARKIGVVHRRLLILILWEDWTAFFCKKMCHRMSYPLRKKMSVGHSWCDLKRCKVERKLYEFISVTTSKLTALAKMHMKKKIQYFWFSRLLCLLASCFDPAK